MRIGLLALTGWILAAVLTVGVSWSAISVVRQSVVPRTEVASALPAPEETGSVTAAPTTPTPKSTLAAVRSYSGQGGTVSARCTGGVPAIVRIVPQQGFRGDPDDSGREVKFESSDHRTEIKIACSGTTPTFSKEEKSTDGGGSGRGRGGGGDDD
ncbi:MAG TPA: hypothetical protein VI357_18790 [Mycobacteriales bacterium]